MEKLEKFKVVEEKSLDKRNSSVIYKYFIYYGETKVSDVSVNTSLGQCENDILIFMRSKFPRLAIRSVTHFRKSDSYLSKITIKIKLENPDMEGISTYSYRVWVGNDTEDGKSIESAIGNTAIQTLGTFIDKLNKTLTKIEAVGYPLDTIGLCERITKLTVGKEYKILGGTQLQLDFTHKNKPTPLIVLVGDTGIGKTTILAELKKDAQFGGNNVFPNCLVYEDEYINDFDEELCAFIRAYMTNNNVTEQEALDTINLKFKPLINSLGTDIVFHDIVHNIAGDLVTYKTRTSESYFYDLSRGERKVLTDVLYIIVYGFKDGLIFLDEPDYGIQQAVHIKLMEFYHQYAIENNCQIIMTTNSINTIAMYEPDFVHTLYQEFVNGLKTIKTQNSLIIKPS